MKRVLSARTPACGRAKFEVQYCSSTEVPSSAFQRRGYLGRFQAGANDGTGFPRSTVSQRKFAEDNAFAFNVVPLV